MLGALKNKNVAISLGVAVVLIGGYLMFFGGGEDTNPLTVTSTPSTEQQTIGRELLVTLRELRSLKLNGELFNDPVFHSLRDFSVALPLQEAGRRNPFAPLGSDASAPAPSGPAR